MAEVTAPLALDETLQQVVSKLGNISSVAGASAYTQAVAGGYTGTQAEFEAQIAKQPTVVNPNLLDNWYFVGGGSQQGGGQFPINQRGQTSYSGGGYQIDRWKSNCATSIGADGISISNSNATNGYFRQDLEHVQGGLPYTMSLLVFGQGDINFTLRDSNWTILLGGIITITSNLIVVTGTLQNDLDNAMFYIGPRTANTQFRLVAVKLEIGDTQTLCHNEGTEENPVWVLNEIPNFTEELWKCQRYYQLFASSSYRPTYGEDYRPPMRVHSPTKGTISIGGTTYYYADANL